MENKVTYVEAIMLTMLALVLGAMLTALLIIDVQKDTIARLKWNNIQTMNCVDGELRLLVQMPDKTRQWIRGKTPIPCKAHAND